MSERTWSLPIRDWLHETREIHETATPIRRYSAVKQSDQPINLIGAVLFTWLARFDAFAAEYDDQAVSFTAAASEASADIRSVFPNYQDQLRSGIQSRECAMRLPVRSYFVIRARGTNCRPIMHYRRNETPPSRTVQA